MVGEHPRRLCPGYRDHAAAASQPRTVMAGLVPGAGGAPGHRRHRAARGPVRPAAGRRGTVPGQRGPQLAAVSGWYAWLARRGHITASPAAGIARPRADPDTPPAPALTRDQALTLVHAADTAPGPQRARTAALVAVLLFTGARVSEVIGANVEDLGTEQGHRVLRVTRSKGRRQSLALPGPAASRIDAYLAGRPARPASRRCSPPGPGDGYSPPTSGRPYAASPRGPACQPT